jgi:hypothetical protein
MRAIFIFLLIANILFFGYHYFNKAPVDVKANPASAQISLAGADKLQLLSERTDLAAKPRKTSEVKKTNTPEPEPRTGLCTMIGPYAQLLHAEYAMEHLASLGVEAHITPIEIKEGELYWVYLQPEMSEREALRRLYELQGKGIESHIITKGELTNGISFGRYADYLQAEIKAKEIMTLGYNVEIKMLPKIIQETWVVVNSGFDEKINENVWVNLLSREDSLEKRQNFCLGVDSP